MTRCDTSGTGIVVSSFLGAIVSLAISGCGGGGGGTAPPVLPEPITVQVTVSASESVKQLSYEWRATDGVISNANNATTTWTLPRGKGLHFAYVLVSNGQGGYVERRIVVSTDDLGIAATSTVPKDFAAPIAPAPQGVPYRSIVHRVGEYDPLLSADPDFIYSPDVFARISDPATGATTQIVKSDLRGFLNFPSVSAGSGLDVLCTLDLAISPVACGDITSISDTAISELNVAGATLNVTDASGTFSVLPGDIVGRLVLSDGLACGTVNEFFRKEVTATASLVDSGGRVLDGPTRLNRWGHFNFATEPGAAALRFECETHPTVTRSLAEISANPRVILTASKAPTVSAMSVKLAGKEIGIFLPPTTGQPSDVVEGADTFLSYKGIDSSKSACEYYRVVGAAKGCDAAGNLIDSISFDDWKRKLKMQPYAEVGVEEFVATFVNKVDLNLTRNHHSISYGPDKTAAYVCNHLGPKDESQQELDRAITAAKAGRDLVACVAMDHTVTPGVNGDRALTRFLIFGPNGKLLPSINLDGRGEKFVPAVCVACHGGEKYAGRFPENGTGSADIGAHFLPYDIGNFGFSSVDPQLSKAVLELPIYGLNQNVLKAGATAATSELIAGWYVKGDKILDEAYLPPSWRGRTLAAVNFYKVYAKSCRTCHVAFSSEFNFDDYDQFLLTKGLGTSASTCGNLRSGFFMRNHSMPNSLTTFNLFWNSRGFPNDQLASIQAFWDELDGLPLGTTQCALRDQVNR